MNLRHCLITCGTLAVLLSGCNQREELAPYPEFLSGSCADISNQDAFLGVPFSFQSQSIGGNPPFQWGANSLPPGLNIDPETGEISGTPSELGSFEVVITVTDSTGHGNVISCGQLLIQEPPQVAIACGPDILGQAVIGVPYSSTVMAAGGIEPYEWSATGLPQNLAINPNTGEISGTVAETVSPGSYDVTIAIADSSDPALTDECPTKLVVREGVTVIPSVLEGVEFPDKCVPLGTTLAELREKKLLETDIDTDQFPITCKFEATTNPDSPPGTGIHGHGRIPPGITFNEQTCAASGNVNTDQRFGTYVWIVTFEQAGSKGYVPYCASQDVLGDAYEVTVTRDGTPNTQLVPGYIQAQANPKGSFSFGDNSPDPQVFVLDPQVCANSNVCGYKFYFSYTTLSGAGNVDIKPNGIFPPKPAKPEGFFHALQISEDSPGNDVVDHYYVVNMSFDYCIAPAGDDALDAQCGTLALAQQNGNGNFEFGLIVRPPSP